jgi:hypothetical protein
MRTGFRISSLVRHVSRGAGTDVLPSGCSTRIEGFAGVSTLLDGLLAVQKAGTHVTTENG